MLSTVVADRHRANQLAVLGNVGFEEGEIVGMRLATNVRGLEYRDAAREAGSR